MLEDIKKLVGEHIEAAKKHNIEYLPWDVTNAYLLVRLSEQVASLQEKMEMIDAKTQKNTQDTKESVETLPEDEGATPETMGDPLDWSDADLDKLAEIGVDDLANAVKIWDDNAPQGFAGLLNAEKEGKSSER